MRMSFTNVIYIIPVNFFRMSAITEYVSAINIEYHLIILDFDISVLIILQKS